jgi:hypothetical protein
MESLARLLEWAGPDLAHNLDFVPDDRLHWKPAPDSKSALECAAEAALFAQSMVPVLEGAEWVRPDYSPGTKEEVQSLLRSASRDYAAALRRIPPEKLGDIVSTAFGDFALGQIAGFPVVDMIHHRGQVCYLQTMLGDRENHFLMG